MSSVTTFQSPGRATARMGHLDSIRMAAALHGAVVRMLGIDTNLLYRFDALAGSDRRI
jgi:hypothetical protein